MQTYTWIMRACIAGGVALIAAALWMWGAVEVRGHGSEVFFLTFFGFVWLALSLFLIPWLGLAIDDDVIERRNPAALIAICGAILSLAMIFAAGNLGEGPSYWENFFSAGVGTLGFFLLWFVLELGGRSSVSVAQERDLASGIRLCGFLLAIGLILGRAITGNWHSISGTVHDFIREGWLAGILCLGAMIVEWPLRPRRGRLFPPWPLCGLLPALIYIAVAIAWLAHLGRWEGMPK